MPAVYESPLSDMGNIFTEIGASLGITPFHEEYSSLRPFDEDNKHKMSNMPTITDIIYFINSGEEGPSLEITQRLHSNRDDSFEPKSDIQLKNLSGLEEMLRNGRGFTSIEDFSDYYLSLTPLSPSLHIELQSAKYGLIGFYVGHEGNATWYADVRKTSDSHTKYQELVKNDHYDTAFRAILELMLSIGPGNTNGNGAR